jgi:ribosomal protein L14E/L6E/L27E
MALLAGVEERLTALIVGPAERNVEEKNRPKI